MEFAMTMTTAVAGLTLAVCGCGSSTSASSSTAAARGHGGDVRAPQRQADELARWVARFDAPDRDTWQRPAEVMALAGLVRGMKVADLGAGTGYFMSNLSRVVDKEGLVLALEVEPVLVSYMRERAVHLSLTNVDIRLVEKASPGLAERSVDRVLVVDTWHLLSNRIAYARELERALNWGGQIVIVEFTREAPMGPPRDQRLSPEVVVRELTLGGLSARVVPETLPHQYVVVADGPRP